MSEVAETRPTEMKPDMALIPMLVLTLVVMTLFIIAQLAYLNPARESLKRPRSNATMQSGEEMSEVAETDDGLGGDEPFCEHGNLLWSEDCDECDAAAWKLSNKLNGSDQ